MLDQDFDLKVRSMLEDAVEEVPDGVWEGVSGALDKAARKRQAPPVFWWRMLAGLTAAAAAVALGIFLWPDRKGDFGKVASPEGRPVAVVVSPKPENVAGQAEMTPETATKTPANVAKSPEIAGIATEMVQNVAEAPEIAGTATETPEIVAESPINVTEHPEAIDQTPAVGRKERVRYISEDSRRAGQASRSFSGNAFASGKPSTDTPGVTRLAAPAKFRAPSATGITPVSKEASYGMPFTVGIGAKYYVLPRFAIGTGVNYSLLVRSFVGTYNEVSTSVEDGVEHSALVRSVTSDIFNDQHYIGVPLTLFYDFVQTGRVRAYVRADGMVEKNIRCHYRFHSASEPMSYVEKVKGVQWSAGAGLGIEVKLGKYVGLYADPGVRYYFKGNQPSSLRTAQPFMMDINAGVRFNIN